jgi:hypothetical protein
MTGAVPDLGEPIKAANDAAPLAEPAPVSPFPALVVGAEEIGCDHLAPFSFVFDTPIREGVHCYVQFTTHCFSDKYDPERHPENVVVVDERGQLRCFDRDRYELSKGLEALIRGLPGNKVYQTPESNFAIITMQDGREYRVFFNVRRDSKKKIKLYVESAYPPDAERFQVVPATAYQKVRFVALVDKVLSNEKLVFKGR